MEIKFTKSAFLFVITLMLFVDANIFAQPGIGISFQFSPQATTTAFPAGATTVAFPAGNQDDNALLAAPAGMNLKFAGNYYQKIVVSTNGWFALVPASVVAVPASLSAGTFLSTNSLSTYAGGYPLIAPFWDDIASTSFQYNWVGNVLWVRWAAKIDKNNATPAFLFWVRMDGTTGVIDFDYTSTAYTITGLPTASIGLAGVCTGDYYSYNSPASPAFADSTVETSNISTKPLNATYTFTPYQLYDNCANAKDLSPLTASCVPATFNINNATTSGSVNCATTDTADIWFKVNKPVGIANVIVTTSPFAGCQSATGTSVEVYAAPCGSAPLACSTTGTTYPTFGEVTVARNACVAETLYVRVTNDNNAGDAGGKFNICAKDAGAAPGVGSTCGNPQWVCNTLPYTYSGTTAGSIDNYDSTSSVCHTLYMNGEDYVFAYTPAANGCIQVDLTTPGTNPGVFVYNGCPNSAGTNCLASAEFATGAGSISAVSLIGGQTYYIVVDNDTAGGNQNNPFTINITNAGSAPANDLCTNATNLGSIINGVSCSPQTFTTECSTPTPVGQAGIPSCVPAHNPPYFIDGVTGDVWLRFTAGFSGALLINTFQSAINPTSNAAMAIYTGACGTMVAPYACDYNSGPNGMPSLSIPVVNGVTYYIRVWSEHPENEGNFDICFQSACAPPNDLPCAAVLVPLGATAPGVNACAGSNGEPNAPFAAQCVAGGTINTVWYKAVVPASGSIRVRTHPLTLTDTQIQGYTFASGCANAATVNSPKACNNNGIPCSGGFSDFSEQLFSGLTPGDTLFVAVDGVGSITGSFEISFIDGTGTIFPPVAQQDCAAAQSVCSTNDIVIADPGYRNNGNVCDLPTGYACWFGTGERNSVWYQFTVDPSLSGGTATISFDIFTASSTDIDFLLWDVTGLSNYCQTIQSLALPPVGCNYAAAGSATGLSPGGTGYYSPSVVFSGAPRTYVMLLNGFNSAANSGYTLHWTAPIATTSTAAIWSGQSDTLYATTTNWGACGATPTCALDATVNATVNGRQPTVAVNSGVKNLTINFGAQLRVKAGITLSVCGNFTNLGTLICEPGSTVQFIGNGLQTISGILTGTNSFANLVINKPAGSVQLLSNIDVAGNYTSSNNTSIFNINGKYMKVGGNFTNFNGTTTFTGISSSTVEFNGTINQNFVNSNGLINLNRVVMNKPSGKLYLAGANSTMNIDSTLALNFGIIVTRSISSLEVNMKYYLPAALSGHNVLSYVDGKLRRKISNGLFSSPVIPASYDFPVGDSLLIPSGGGGYELANITFTSATLVNDLLAYFDRWPGAVPNPGPLTSECVYATYSNRPIFNHGYWTFKRASANFTGNYTISLHNTGVTNNTGAGWTVAKTDTTSNVSLSASWRLLGSCVIASTPANTQRININLPANDTTSFNHRYTTVQSDQQLPIELLYFNAVPKGEDVLCTWETASETNNDFFDVERSNDGRTYERLGKVKGYGQGISTDPIKYSFVDHDLCEDIRYYRLKQVDIDGNYSYSNTVAVNCKRISGIELFPNPANNSITYRFNQNKDDILMIIITDIAGRIVNMTKADVIKGINSITTNIEDLAAGSYNLRIVSPDEVNAFMQVKFFKN